LPKEGQASGKAYLVDEFASGPLCSSVQIHSGYSPFLPTESKPLKPKNRAMIPALIVLALLLITLLIVISRKPDTFRYTRSLAIGASPAVIYPWLQDLHQFQSWNPWASEDPSSVLTYSGPDSGPGASSTWSGNRKVGEGTMTITDTTPDQLVRVRMEFRKPFAATNTVEFTLEPQGTNTLVSWIMYGPQPFIGKVMDFFIGCEKMCGSQFTKGLTSLKILVESPAKA